MFPGMMDPEMIRLAQEQMSRMSPAELSRIQQQMMSNPDLMRMASESMKYMNPEDLKHAAEQLKSTQPHEMTEIGEKMASATPEELAAMRSRVDAQISYELNAAEMLKKQGNELHSQGKFSDALQKYLRAKNNLKGIPTSKGRGLLLACSLNLMSCYLKTGEYDECIKEGVEVLASDATNVKALYRRGQAYKNLGQLQNAVSDLSKALEFSPDDVTIADVLRDAEEKLAEHGGEDAHRGLRIEEITDEVPTPLAEVPETSPMEASAQKTEDISTRISSQCSDTRGTSGLPSNSEYLQALKDDKDSIRSFQKFMSQADPETLTSLGGGKMEGISPDMVKAASDVFGKMPPEEFQRMLQMAASFQGQNPLTSDASLNSTSHGLPNITPDMLKTATDMMSNIPTEELQKMFATAPSLNGNISSTASSSQSNGFGLNTETEAQERLETSTVDRDIGESGPSEGFLNSRSAPQPSFPSSSFDMQEQVRNQMKNPAMREMMSSMMRNMSPEMMANMSEQFGLKISREEAERAQQAMSSLSPEHLDRMMKWADRAQRTVEGARKTKNWLLGKQGLIMAVIMLVIAVLLHRLGYIG